MQETSSFRSPTDEEDRTMPRCIRSEHALVVVVDVGDPRTRGTRGGYRREESRWGERGPWM